MMRRAEKATSRQEALHFIHAATRMVEEGQSRKALRGA